MKNKSYIVWIVFGAVLIFSALLLVFVNTYEDNKSAEASRKALTEVVTIIAENAGEEQNKPEEEKPEYEDIVSQYFVDRNFEIEKTIVTEDGREYIGVVSIPAIELELPVQSKLTYENLDVSPCRYFGRQSGGNLIIGAHNYRAHFRDLDELVSGDEIYFTDAVGNVYLYNVIQTELINGRDGQKLEDGVEEWDLTLFTCNYSGYSRVTVRAVLVETYLVGEDD